MKIAQNSFNQNLNKNFLFEKFPKIAIAISGGPDSMCLAFLLNKWIKKNKGEIIALIIDHQLREKSNIEAKYIKKYLSSYKIKSKIIKINKKNINKKTMKEARENRFKKLIRYCHQNKILHLFVGHHYDDNLETFLLRKLAGSNLEGLRGIQNKLNVKGLQILRPLLIYKKKDILNFNKKNNIIFLSDPSNINQKYSRVIVRNFLSQNLFYKKYIIKDFKKIIKNYHLYKKMIFQILNQLSISFSSKKIVIDKNKFFKHDQEIQSKIIEIIYKYLKPNRTPLRYKKIIFFIDILSNHNNDNSNLAGMHIKKDQYLIDFSV